MNKDITGILTNIHDKEPERVEAVCPNCSDNKWPKGKVRKGFYVTDNSRRNPGLCDCYTCKGTGTIKAGPISHDIIDKEKKDTPIDVREEEEREG